MIPTSPNGGTTTSNTSSSSSNQNKVQAVEYDNNPNKYIKVFTTVSDLSNGKYNELRFNAASDTVIEGEYISTICNTLGKCGIDIENTNVYDETVEAAVKQFQEKVNMSQTGILTNSVLSAMMYYAYRMNDNVEDNSVDEDGIGREKSSSPHYNSFFDDDKFKLHRLNHKDIKIVLGNHSVVKTIKDVFMRSVSVEVDTSGNPISEVYEFIARDIKESDELTDVTKYNGDEVSASSDIKYIFNFNSST